MSNQLDTNFDFTPQQRSQLLEYLVGELEEYYGHTETLKVTPDLDLARIIQAVRTFDLEVPVHGLTALKTVLQGMKDHTVHTPHPMYYGLYNPRANFAGILADLITAVINPQLAAWSHSPYASEVENYLVETFGLLFGYQKNNIDGVFASGGAEANFTAILCALNHHFPQVASEGLRSLDSSPLIYCTQETHHSIMKGARMAGLGSGSVRLIAVDDDLKMRTDDLKSAIEADTHAGLKPAMVVATAGTTGTGTIDHLQEIGVLCAEKEVWYHVDAAYGGATVVDGDFKQWIDGIEMSNSLIVDLHKWFSVPMAASMFITSDPDILHTTFGINTGYMPGDARGLQITDPFAHSFQWSRRFAGLKLYLALLMYGMEGYRKIIREQIVIGNRLRELLMDRGWSIKNETPLPVICFTDDHFKKNPEFARDVCDDVVKSGEAWVSVYPLRGDHVLRACVTNYNTRDRHIEKLVDLLDVARKNVSGKKQSLDK